MNVRPADWEPEEDEVLRHLGRVLSVAEADRLLARIRAMAVSLEGWNWCRWPSDSRAARKPGSIYAERVTPRGIEAGARFVELARASGRTAGRLALLWCKDQPGVTAPIVGPRTFAQLRDLLPMLEMSLTAEERTACDAINGPGGVLVNLHNTAPWMKTPSL